MGFGFATDAGSASFSMNRLVGRQKVELERVDDRWQGEGVGRLMPNKHKNISFQLSFIYAALIGKST
jgi:hypothetical protein